MKSKTLQEIFNLMTEMSFEEGQRVVPYTLAPAVTSESISLMNFSLIPSWSKERKLKFATHNARLETIDEKATWKKPFLKNHCIIPMNAFIEPIYTGDLKGNMVFFNSPNLLFAAGIFDSWVDRSTGEIVDSFAVITSEPCSFVKNIGHDRQPVFLTLEKAKQWLSLNGNFSELKNFLASEPLVPSLTTAIDRPMRPGWKKRIKPSPA